MTRLDKQNMLLAIILAISIIAVTYHWPGNSVRLTVSFLAALLSLMFWMSRAVAAPWLVECTDDRMVCRKPLILKLLFWFFALLMVALMWALRTQPFGVAFFGLLFFLFLFSASDYKLQLVLSERKYVVSRGFGPLTRSALGKLDGGTILAISANKGMSQVQFRPAGHRWGLPLICFLQSSDVRNNAERTANLFNLSIEEKGNR